MRDTISESQVVLAIMAGTGVRPSPNLVEKILHVANKHRDHGVWVTDKGTIAIANPRGSDPPITTDWFLLIKPSAYMCEDWLSGHADAIRAANDQYGLDWLLDPQ